MNREILRLVRGNPFLTGKELYRIYARTHDISKVEFMQQYINAEYVTRKGKVIPFDQAKRRHTKRG